MLLMLEDNPERIERFTATLKAIDPTIRLVLWRNAWSMIGEMATFLPQARLISLDHDLEPIDGDKRDPGDGLEVTKFLVAQPVKCPVIIHSSNTERSTWMAGEFELARWKYKSVAPIGDDWIEQDWRRVAQRFLKQSRSPRLS